MLLKEIAMNDKKLSIGEFAKLTGTTVRTLQYYDSMDVLKPSYLDSNNHRFYTEKDETRYYQVVALKKLGMSLNQINEFIKSDYSDEDVNIIISRSIKQTNLEISKLEKTIKNLNELKTKLADTQELDWKMMYKKYLKD